MGPSLPVSFACTSTTASLRYEDPGTGTQKSMWRTSPLPAHDVFLAGCIQKELGRNHGGLPIAVCLLIVPKFCRAASGLRCIHHAHRNGLGARCTAEPICERLRRHQRCQSSAGIQLPRSGFLCRHNRPCCARLCRNRKPPSLHRIRHYECPQLYPHPHPLLLPRL